MGVRSGAVQNKAVYVVRAKMLKRTGHGLRYLDGKRCGRIVRQAVVLAVLIGKFCLKKKIGVGDEAGAICGGKTLANSGFKIVAALVGCVDGAKARANGEFSQGRSAIFLPGSAVKKIGNGRLSIWHALFWHEDF